MTVFLTGATGQVGQAVRRRLAQAGVAVHALTRSGTPTEPGPAGEDITWFPGDVGDP
ncbi:sugar nucleotide-binding protein, partial [Candidatus Saccharibacteria bacterium]|nr:sugar nucleotide-binding protein [Candidatus Saccharibacteria bacterium]